MCSIWVVRKKNVTFMPSHRDTARSGLSARNVRSALNAPMLPTPAPSAPRLIIDICIIIINQSINHINQLINQQEVFEKCWAHSPQRAASRQFTRCRHCTVARHLRIDVHNDDNDNDDDDDDNDNEWQRGPLWPHGMGQLICLKYFNIPVSHRPSVTSYIS